MDYNHLCLPSCIDISTKYSRAVLLLWIIHAIYVLCLLCFRACLFIDALWSPAWKGLTSWFWFVMSYCEFVTFPLYPRSGVILDCIDSRYLPPLSYFSYKNSKSVYKGLPNYNRSSLTDLVFHNQIQCVCYNFFS